MLRRDTEKSATREKSGIRALPAREVAFSGVAHYPNVAAHARISPFAWENALNRGLGGGEGGIRTPGATRAHVISSHAG
jgi:hypothetical protein